MRSGFERAEWKDDLPDEKWEVEEDRGVVEEEEELASLPCVQLALLSLRFNLQLWVTHIPASEAEIHSREQLRPERQ